ncbi:MAG: class I SAM-dependent methyltransferase [Phycisphaerales bacterium]|nr:class I SAM-dependent methyltransferase [Phycisphaerales bacterium]
MSHDPVSESLNSPPLPRLYTEFAKYWTLVSAPEDYAQEAEHWINAVRSRLGPGRHRALELGVGGGNNMSHMTREFEFVAADASADMIEQARSLNPEVELHVGDMRTIRLGKTFDAVLIHDAISYMLTEDDLRAVFATARAHLRSGGVLVTAPDWYRETFRDSDTSASTRRINDVELTMFEYSYDTDPTDTTYDTIMWLLIRKAGGSPQVERDHHRLGLFPLATWEGLMVEAGFGFGKDRYDVHEDGREAYLLVGVNR